MSSTSSKVGLVIMIGVAVFAGAQLAQQVRDKQDHAPDPGCSAVAGGQVCPLPSASITISPAPSKAAAKKDEIPADQSTDEPTPAPAPTRIDRSPAPVNPDNPTAGGETGGHGVPQPTLGVRPTVFAHPSDAP